MKDNKEVKISYWAHHLTTIISVTLVLLLVGIISLIWIGADRETNRLKEQVELSVILTDSLPDNADIALKKKIESQPYSQNVALISKEDALKTWIEETGEDLVEFFGVNPLSPEINFSVKAEYASAEQLKQIQATLQDEPGVEAVALPDAEMIEAMNKNISRITWILAVVVAIMLLISFVLINNTVHLTISGRRFAIHTMKLVGATNSFIRKPIVINNLIAGLISGVAAGVLTGAFMAAVSESGFNQLVAFIGWDTFALLAATLILLSCVLCTVASVLSANVYLRKDYDALFK